MTIAVATFPGFAALDVTGPYEVFTRLPGAEVVLCAAGKGMVEDKNGLLHLRIDVTFAEVPRPDVLLVPGAPPRLGWRGRDIRSWTGCTKRPRTRPGPPRCAPAR
jgi:putative intracellular protease/amidase